MFEVLCVGLWIMFEFVFIVVFVFFVIVDFDCCWFVVVLIDLVLLNWIIIGDLIIYGFVYIQGGCSYLEYLYELICGEFECVCDIVFNMVISGNCIVDFLDDWDC